MYSFFTIHDDSICLFNVHIVLCAVCDSKIMFRKLRPISLSPHALSRHFHQWNQKVQIPQSSKARKKAIFRRTFWLQCVKRGQLFFLSCLSFVLELYNFWYRINNLTNISISKTGLFAFNLFFFFLQRVHAALHSKLIYEALIYWRSTNKRRACLTRHDRSW